MPLLSMPPLFVNFIITIFLFIVCSPTSHGADEENYTTCHEIKYNCGQLKGIGYPFWGEGRPRFCGVQGFELTCYANGSTTIVIQNQTFHVLRINQSANNMTIARADLWDSLCPVEFSNTTLNFTLFDYGPHPRVLNLTLFYDCLPESAYYDQIKDRSYFNCTGGQSSSNINFFVDELLPINPPNCKSRIKVPVFQEALDEFLYRWEEHMTLENLVKRGFEADYHEMDKFQHCKACNASGGECGTNTTTNQAICFFQGEKKKKLPAALCIGLGAVGTLLVVAIVFIIYHLRNKKYNATSSWISRYTSHTSSMNDIEKEAS